ncbi:MAG TPA: SDR family oxidoreductase [Sphingomonadaceae bacterium]|nr:SDR family oxidoreductase [Sphingomonadaceae bacterium]
MKTVLITGCSSGYGLETARHFHEQGWNVVATMRNPRVGILPESDRMSILPLDVTQADSIAAAVEAAGPLDVLVNNAGIGLAGVLEATPMARIRAVFETNTLGTIAMCQAVIPQMRERGAGVIVNVTSSVTLMPMPLVAAYTASKTAVQGFTASLALELAGFGIRAKLVEPGYGPSTRFAENTDLPLEEMIPQAYAGFAGPILEAFAQPAQVTTPQDVAEVVWRVATHPDAPLRNPAGPDAVALAALG